jgi:2-polyprenyl-6-methoxyphenol hydroxylase-like FAD-dependent oxidoreductase
VNVFRPWKVTGMKRNDHEMDNLDVSFENGDVIQAKYVIGADGARSSVGGLDLESITFLICFATK